MRHVVVAAILAAAASLSACGSPGEDPTCDPMVNPACPCEPACDATKFCRAGACVACNAHETTCGDGFDDDCDGLTDCADPDCDARQCAADDYACTDDVCTSGACTHAVSQNGTTCNDGDSCTQNDTCQSGICVPGSTIPCATPPGECYEPQGFCDQAGCHYVPKQVGTACTSDGNACTSDACDGAGACVHVVQEGLDCNDGDACTTGTTCSAAATCTGGTQVTCTTPPPTGCYEATAACDSVRGCVYAPIPYNTPCASDGNACTRDVCNAGACTHPANAGATCDDGDACTTGERCSSSATCGSGTAVLCPSTDCKAGTCNSATGCYQVNVANGTVCTTDANECTSDVCQSGVCEHLSGPLDGQACTPDANTCTTDRCSAGNCTHTAQSSCNGGCPCPAGQTCCGTSCVALSTDEGNCGACGNTCDELMGCDPNACWVSDCNAGVCSACRWTNDC